MKKHALLIINIGETDHALYTRPLMQRYCERYDLALVELRTPQLNLKGNDPVYQYLIFEKFQIADVLNEYQRVLRLDTDVLISPAAPDIFAAVPQECIGAVFEDCGGRKEQRHSQMEITAKSFGETAWGSRRYFNSGVLVASRMHQNAFVLTKEDRRIICEGNLGGCKEQNLCNWKVRCSAHKIQQLDYRYNHISMFSERWNGHPHRMGSFFIHHAGSQKRKQQRLRRDSRRLLAAWDSGSSPLPWWRRR